MNLFLVMMIVVLFGVIGWITREKNPLIKWFKRREKEDTSKFLTDDWAKEMPIETYNEMFEDGKTIIEKETSGFTVSWDEWANSDIKYFVPVNCQAAFDLVKDKGAYALTESIMIDGKVFAMDRRVPNMFSSPEALAEYVKTLYFVFLVYTGVSPIDRKTLRWFVVGAKQEDGIIPTHGL